MRTYKMILGAAAAVLLSACIPSVKPFYTQQDLVMDARLLGTWQAAVGSDGPQSWRFEEKGEDAYKLTVTEEGDKTGLFTARLFRLEQGTLQSTRGAVAQARRSVACGPLKAAWCRDSWGWGWEQPLIADGSQEQMECNRFGPSRS